MRRFFLISVLSVCTAAMAQDTCSIAQRVYSFRQPLVEVIGYCFDNPSIKPYEHLGSLSALSAGFDRYSESEPIDVQRGDGYNKWIINADSYIKYKNATIWGSAAYQQGKLCGLRWNETADPQLIYPYLTADSIGGDMSLENYSLRGGYAATSDRLTWDAQLSYDAGLYYRNVDPRPKDVTGLIDLKVGCSYLVADDYALGLSLDMSKYKQTCDIMFMSEAGKTEVLHLTGLANHYVRFAGTAETSHYSGSTFGFSLDLMPTDRIGFVANVSASTFSFSKTLTDLNKLPLCDAWHREIKGHIGYIARRWTVTSDVKAYRRHGSENIFGDAQSGVYPMIGSLEMYADNMQSFGLSSAYDLPLSVYQDLSFFLRYGYQHRSEVYVGSPAELTYYSHTLSGAVKYKGLFSNGWLLRGYLSGDIMMPSKSSLTMDDGTDEGLYDAIYNRYYYMQRSYGKCGLSCELVKALSYKYAIALEFLYSKGLYRGEVSSDSFHTSLKLIF